MPDDRSLSEKLADELARLLATRNLTLGTSISDWSHERALAVEASLSRAIIKHVREHSHERG